MKSNRGLSRCRLAGRSAFPGNRFFGKFIEKTVQLAILPKAFIDESIYNEMSALRVESGELAYCGESALPWALIVPNSAFPHSRVHVRLEEMAVDCDHRTLRTLHKYLARWLRRYQHWALLTVSSWAVSHECAALDQRFLPALEISSTAGRFQPIQQPSAVIAPCTSERNRRSRAQGWSIR